MKEVRYSIAHWRDRAAQMRAALIHVDDASLRVLIYQAATDYQLLADEAETFAALFSTLNDSNHFKSG